MEMEKPTRETIRRFFDEEIRKGRRLLPDPSTVSGLGTYLKYEQAAALMAQPDVQTVLDVGCNLGAVELLFHRQYPDEARDTFVAAVDLSREAIGRAGNLGLQRCHFQVSDALALPYPARTFDLVVMVETIEHVVEKEQALSEAWRVLKPLGTLFLATPNPRCWALRIEAALWKILRSLFARPQPAKDIFIARHDLERLLDSVGFHVTRNSLKATWPRLFVYFAGWGVLPPLPPKALYRYQRLCLRVLDRAEPPDLLDSALKWSLVALVRKRS
jgi:ubiquinone/menaquinone biosynthesis C-methylase UbiE